MSGASSTAPLSFEIDIQKGGGVGLVPDDEEIGRWADVAMQLVNKHAALCIRITDDVEIAELNAKFRHGTGPTNVLSFPCELEDETGVSLLGDVVICAAVIEREAQDQHKALSAHFAHMVLHGILHLLGYDHQNSVDSEVMEQMEAKLLDQLGFADPYQPM
jgi:probable rRNA maturation factor